MRDPVVIEVVVPFEEVDESFDWWMRQYERDPDGQYLFFARLLQPHVTTSMYERWRREFEHPKGEANVVISLRGPDHSAEGECQRHSKPAWPGYCE